MSGIAKVGPIRTQADSVAALLRSRATIVHLVTLLEDMPVTETEEAVASLRQSGTGVGTVIENMVNPSPFEPAVLADVAAGRRRARRARAGTRPTTPRSPPSSPSRPRAPSSSRCATTGCSSSGCPSCRSTSTRSGSTRSRCSAIAEQLTDQLALEAA